MIIGVRDVERGTEEWENESFVAEKLEDKSDDEKDYGDVIVISRESIRDSGTTFGGMQHVYMEFSPRKSTSSDMTAGTPITVTETLRGSDGELTPNSTKKWGEEISTPV